jgi:hypothetical protein
MAAPKTTQFTDTTGRVAQFEKFAELVHHTAWQRRACGIGSKGFNLVHHGEHAIAHGLHWSTWRRRHQTQARRTHVRQRLRLQTLMI